MLAQAVSHMLSHTHMCNKSKHGTLRHPCGGCAALLPRPLAVPGPSAHVDGRAVARQDEHRALRAAHQQGPAAGDERERGGLGQRAPRPRRGALARLARRQRACPAQHAPRQAHLRRAARPSAGPGEPARAPHAPAPSCVRLLALPCRVLSANLAEGARVAGAPVTVTTSPLAVAAYRISSASSMTSAVKHRCSRPSCTSSGASFPPATCAPRLGAAPSRHDTRLASTVCVRMCLLLARTHIAMRSHTTAALRVSLFGWWKVLVAGVEVGRAEL